MRNTIENQVPYSYSVIMFEKSKLIHSGEVTGNSTLLYPV